MTQTGAFFSWSYWERQKSLPLRCELYGWCKHQWLEAIVKLSAVGENVANGRDKQSWELEEMGSSRTLFELLVLVRSCRLLFNPPHIVIGFFVRSFVRSLSLSLFPS